jgi:predicted nicotinamide N-methyase
MMNTTGTGNDGEPNELPISEKTRPNRSLSSSPENDVFNISTALIPPAQVKSAGTASETFGGLLGKPLLLHEDLREGCGGQLWPAGMVLSKYMLTYHRHQLCGKSIIEIGAGGGLVGLAVALGCDLGEKKQKILITDQEPMFALMQKNIALNDLSEKAEARIYDWGTKAPTFPANFQSTPDIVLAADCVYFEPAFPLLLQTLTDLIGSNTICYFCFKKRRKADMRFIRDMRRKLVVREIEYEDREADQKEGIHLLEVKSKTT